jgi:hypothetical protein
MGALIFFFSSGNTISALEEWPSWFLSNKKQGIAAHFYEIKRQAHNRINHNLIVFFFEQFQHIYFSK